MINKINDTIKVFFYTFGCKVNQSETDEIINQSKIETTGNINEANISVINCCSVTSSTLSKISKIVNKSLKLQNIKRIFIIGCITENLENKYKRNNRIVILKSDKKFDIIKELNKIKRNKNICFSESFLNDKDRVNGANGAGVDVNEGDNEGDSGLDYDIEIDGNDNVDSSQNNIEIDGNDNVDSSQNNIEIDGNDNVDSSQNNIEVDGDDNVDSSQNNRENIIDNDKKLLNISIKKRRDLKTRTFIKIQDGCNNFCSYCIVPYLRTNLKSIEIEQVIFKIQEKINLGFKEIVLCGISTGNYGHEINEPNYLYLLLKKIVENFNKKNVRFRLTSINPDKISYNLIKIILDEDIFCSHIHIPLQSGSDNVLKKMKRKYNQNSFLKTIEMIKNINSYTGITTDIIVGFPGETKKDFLETKKVIELSGFLRTHLFTYSTHDITEASKFKDTIQDKIKKERYNILNETTELETKKYLTKMLNKNLTVLIENKSKEKIFNGYSSEYIMSKIINIETKKRNEFITLKAKEIKHNSIILL